MAPHCILSVCPACTQNALSRRWLCQQTPIGRIFVPIPVAFSPSEFENEHFFMQCGSVQVGRTWRKYNYLAKEITQPVFSVFIQCALQDLSPELENLLCPLKGVSLIFCSQKQQQLKTCSSSVCIPMAQLASLTHREAHFSQKDKSTCREAILSWWHWLPGSWLAYGVSGRSRWLPEFRLAGDGLAGINWLQLRCHFWPEWQFGRALRCEKQSSNLFPSPALLPTATWFLLTWGWCSLPLFVCASACTPFPVVVAFERHQRLLHLAPVSVLLLMAVWIQDRFQQKNNGHHFFLLFNSLICGWHMGHCVSSLPWDVLARMWQPTENW